MSLRELHHKLEQLFLLVSQAEQINTMLDQDKGVTVEDFLAACLQVDPMDMDDIAEIGACFDLNNKTRIKNEAHAMVSKGLALIDNQWRFAPVK